MGSEAPPQHCSTTPLAGTFRVTDNRLLFAMMAKDPDEDDRRRIRAWCADSEPVELSATEAQRIRLWQGILWNEACLAGKAAHSKGEGLLSRKVRITHPSGLVLFPGEEGDKLRQDREKRRHADREWSNINLESRRPVHGAAE